MMDETPTDFRRHVPNLITIGRIVAGPVGALAYIYGWMSADAFNTIGAQIGFFVAFACLLLGAGADYVDGWLARRWNVQSALGALLDPIADKVLVNCFLLAFLIRLEFDPFLAIPVVVILLRDILVTVKRLQRPVSGQGELQVSQSAKYKTALQMMILVLPFVMDLLNLMSAIYLWVGGVWFIALLSAQTALGYFKKNRSS